MLLVTKYYVLIRVASLYVVSFCSYLFQITLHHSRYSIPINQPDTYSHYCSLMCLFFLAAQTSTSFNLYVHICLYFITVCNTFISSVRTVAPLHNTQILQHYTTLDLSISMFLQFNDVFPLSFSYSVPAKLPVHLSFHSSNYPLLYHYQYPTFTLRVCLDSNI